MRRIGCLLVSILGLTMGSKAYATALDNFLTWDIEHQLMDFDIELADQFLEQFEDFEVLSLERFANPADQDEGGIFHPDNHFNWYLVDGPRVCAKEVTFDNKFGNQTVTLKPVDRFLLVPANKDNHGDPTIDHFLCYEVVKGESVDEMVNLDDQFTDEPIDLMIREPKYFCNPVAKIHNGVTTPITNPIHHLVFYEIEDVVGVSEFPNAKDQFNLAPGWTLEVSLLLFLGVPTFKGEEVCLPATSTWGLIAFTMLILAVGTVVLRRRVAMTRIGFDLNRR